ncbi:MAG: ECF transporter S component [Candidatus Geothermarchaeales archaeon]
MKVRWLSTVSTLVALSAVARLVLPFPNMKPNAVLAILGGILLGGPAGFFTGAMGMLISDFYLGAGYWTIGTSGFMGLIGAIGGYLWHGRASRIPRAELAVGGFLLTLIFDIGTSIWVIPIIFPEAPLVLYMASAFLGLFFPVIVGQIPYPFGLVHELTTAVLLSSVTPSVVRHFRELTRFEVHGTER